MEEKQALQLIANFINTKSEAKISEFNQVNQAIEILDMFIDAQLSSAASVPKKPKKS